jgi:hypothetical protein
MVVKYIFLTVCVFYLKSVYSFHAGKRSAFKLTDTLWLIAAFGVIYDGTEAC